jgi:hypothetical protein
MNIKASWTQVKKDYLARRTELELIEKQAWERYYVLRDKFASLTWDSPDADAVSNEMVAVKCQARNLQDIRLRIDNAKNQRRIFRLGGF